MTHRLAVRRLGLALALCGAGWLLVSAQSMATPGPQEAPEEEFEPLGDVETFVESPPMVVNDPPVPPGMEKLYAVILRRGHDWTPGVSGLSQRLDEAHRAHVKRMTEMGKLLVIGPFDLQDDDTMSGLCVYRAGSLAEARDLADQDPAVVAGRIMTEPVIWYVPKGSVTFPLAVPEPAPAPAPAPPPALPRQ